MPTPAFVLELRRHVGTAQLWLPGVTCVVLRDGDHGPEVLLARRADSGAWTPICGIMDPGEEPDQTAIREAREEACVDIAVERLISVESLPEVTYDNGDRVLFLDHALRARWTGGVARVGDEENGQVGWFSPDALPDNVNARFRRTIALALADTPGVVLGDGRLA